MKTKIGIVGASYGAAVHLPAFQSVEGAEVIALADSGSGRARDAASPKVATFSDWRLMLDDIALDILVVATPPSFQSIIVQSALNKGLSIVCEKPFGASTADALAMVASLSDPLKGFVGFQYRYEPGIVALRQIMASGQLGQVQNLSLKWLTTGRANPKRPWCWQHDRLQGGGVINTFVPHVLDLLNHLSGTEPILRSLQTRILVPERYDVHGIMHHVTAEDWVAARFDLGTVSSDIEVSNCVPHGHGMEIIVQGTRAIAHYHQRPPFGPTDTSLFLDNTKILLDYPIINAIDTRLIAASRLATAVIANHPDTPTFTHGLAIRRHLDILLDSSCRPQ